MFEEFIENMKKNQTPLMTESEYRDFLKKQKIEDIKEIIAGVGFCLLWVFLWLMTAIFN